MKNQKGFSLVELLVVVIIIAIIAAIAIPNLLASRRAANQASAVADLRTLNSAEVTYLSVAGNNTTYGDFTGLQGQGLIDPSWTAATVTKNTFTFSLARNGTNTQYCAMATSTDTSANDYAVSTDGTLYQGANGTADCTGGAAAGGLTVVVGAS